MHELVAHTRAVPLFPATHMIALLLPLAAAFVQYEPCEKSQKLALTLTNLQIKPENVVPGERTCMDFNITSEALPLHKGMALKMKIYDESSHFHDAGIEYDLCDAANTAKCTSGKPGSVSGTVCERIPLAAMLLAGQRVPFKLTVHLHPLGTPVMCARAFAPVADAIALDADVESVADTNAHHPLRRALMDARSASPSTSDGVDAVRSLLEEAYSASPDWADTFELWKVTHGKTYGAPAEQVPQQSEAEEAAAVLAEARAFAQFRENVLTAHRAGRSLSLDERSDKTPDARRTLGHFG